MKIPYSFNWSKTINGSVDFICFDNVTPYYDEISDSDKTVEASKEPIKDTHVHNTSVGTTSVDSVITGVVIIGRGGRRDMSGGTSIISSNVITDVLTDSSKMILKSDSFPLDPLKSKTFVIASQN